MNRARVAAVLAVTSMILAIVFAFVPPRMNASEITWTPSGSEDSGALRLTRRAPERMVLETTCAAIRDNAQPDIPVFSAGSVELALEEDDLAFRPKEGNGAHLPMPDGDCDVTAAYRIDPSSLSLRVDEATDTVSAAQPEVYQLLTTGTAVDKVTITTQANSLAPSWLRWSLALASLALCLAAWRLTRTGTRPRSSLRGRAAHLARSLRWADLAVLTGLLALAVVVPAQYDEGWVLVRSRLLDRGWFGNVYETADAWLPQGFWHESVYHVLQSAGLGFIQLRVVVALMLACTWVLLRVGVLDRMVGDRASRWPPVAAAYLAFAGAWLLTLRAEPVVATLGVAAVTAWVSYRRRPGPGPLFWGLLASGAAISTHQTGWVTLAPASLLLAGALGTARRDKTLAWGLGAAVACAGAVSALLMFAAVDISTIADGAKTFAESGHQMLIVNEPQRFIMNFNGDTAAGRAYVLPILLALFIVGSPGVGDHVERRALWTVSLVWIGGLALTSSKWPAHLGVMVVPAVILAALAAVAWRERESRFPGRGTLLVTLLIGAATSFTVAGPWGIEDLASSDWVDMSHLLTGSAARPYWYAAIGACAILGWLANSQRSARAFATALICAVLLLPLAVSMGWVLRDNARPGWSASGANLRHLAGMEDCGPPTDWSVATDVTPLSASEDLGEPGSRLAPGAFPRVSELSNGPLGRIDTWGTWFAKEDEESPDTTTGEFDTPDYSVGDVSEIAFWTSSGDPENTVVEAVFDSAGGDETRVEVEPGTEKEWALHRVPVPKHSATVRLRIDDSTDGYGGWAAVSSPVSEKRTTPVELFDRERVYVAPGVVTRYACMDVPRLDDGYWHDFDYLVDEPTYLWMPNLPGLTVTQVACESSQSCLRHLDYPMAKVTARPAGQ